ncbi:MAG: 5'-nucleotidase C-terminal domain-containing protein [Phycisphaerales bacterium]|nr:5'-nucleotidase C-terminal domain-containing protein [Phycisphaerales bacterium]
MIPLVSKTQYWIFYLLLLSTYSCQRKQYSHCFLSAQHYEVRKDSTYVDTAVSNWVSEYQKKLQAALQTPIAACEQPLSKAQPESSLGNLIADAVLQKSNSIQKVDAAIVHYHCMAKDYLAPGSISPKDIFELFPKNQKIALLSVSGTMLQQICDSIAQFKGMPIAGIRMKISNNYKAINIEIKHQQLKENLIYTIAVNQSLIQSKPFSSLLGHLSYSMTSFNLRTTLLDYLQDTTSHQHPIKPLLDNRISYAE